MSYDNIYEDEFKQNLKACLTEFNSRFNTGSEIVAVCAPGRVNLIGEHIDYNDGFVFPMAIPLYTVIVGALNNDNVCRIKSLQNELDTSDYVEFDVNDFQSSRTHYRWANYIKGVIANFHGTKRSFNAVIKSNVPLGSGLSSSAALEVSTYTLLENLTGEFTDPVDKAKRCQKAEHEYANCPCGIMDQFISSMGKENNALLIDCRSLEGKLYPFSDPDTSILITNSNVKHELGESEYSTRRANCIDAAKSLNKPSLRDVTIYELNDNSDKLSDEVFRRARHAVTEIKRTELAAEALTNNNMPLLGKLMNESHESLRHDFNVSCDELDSLVEIALSCDGVYGSRMTGAGFGGCTVTLVRKEFINNLIDKIKTNYKGVPTFYVCRPCNGAHRINLPLEEN